MAGFMRRGKSKYYFLTTIASSTRAPTVAEIGAGSHLTSPSITNLMVGIDGFSSTSTFIDVQAFASRQTLKLAGEQQSADSTLDFLEDDTSNPLRTTLARDVTGYLVESPTGGTVAAGLKVNVYPIQVGSNTPVRSAGNEAATFRVACAITSIPAEDIAVLA